MNKFIRFYLLVLLMIFLPIFHNGCSRKSDTASPSVSSANPPQSTDTSPPTYSTDTTTLTSDTITQIPIPSNLKPGGLLGEYFAWSGHGNYFTNRPVFSRVDNEIGFNWEVYAPDTRIPDNRFSIRWSGYIKIDEDGDYRFRLDADDGAELTIGDKRIFPMSLFSRRETVNLTKGIHKIILDYYEEEGVALCYLFWSEPPYRLTSLIPSDHLFYEEPNTTPQPLTPRILNQ